MRRIVTFVSLLVVSFSLHADMPMSFGRSPAQPREFGAPSLRNAQTAATEVAILGEVASFEVEQLKRRNEADGRLRNGIVRPLDVPFAVAPPRIVAADAAWHWRGTVRVDGAHGVRLQLTDLRVPEGTVFWVYGEDGEAIGFDASLAHDGELWTPTIYSEAITLETSAPGRASFTIAGVADIRADREVVANATECFRDAACHMTGSVANSATAIASYSFISGGSSYVCSGGLIIDGPRTFAPNFLTANHCLSTGSEAASVEAYWDYRASSCGATPPSRSSRPRTNGATLLATSEATDVTLLKLSSVPGERYWLGWSSSAVTSGMQLHRISNPGGGAAVYSTSVVETVQGTCTGKPRPSYIYQTPTVGGTAGGSSGSPVLRDAGIIVGQLTGGCGPDTANPCNYANRDFDGALSQSYPLLAPYIDADAPPPTCSACTPNAKTACLLNKRFKVEVRWQNRFFDPMTSGTGDVVSYAENRPEVHPTYGPLTESAYFSFFAPGRVELVVKALSGVTINDKFWIFAAGLTNNEYWIKVTDTKTCATWEKANAHGSFSNITDFTAFPFP